MVRRMTGATRVFALFAGLNPLFLVATVEITLRFHGLKPITDLFQEGQSVPLVIGTVALIDGRFAILGPYAEPRTARVARRHERYRQVLKSSSPVSYDPKISCGKNGSLMRKSSVTLSARGRGVAKKQSGVITGNDCGVEKVLCYVCKTTRPRRRRGWSKTIRN
jgi:hypothetical protein